MKILQINTCSYRRGGADVVYLNTTQLLRERGHEVINFSQMDSSDFYATNNIYSVNQIDYIGLSPLKKLIKSPRFFYSLETKHKIEQLIRIERPDVAHIHLYRGILTPSILTVLKQNNIPIVFSLHDYEMLCPHNTFIDGKGNICEKCMVQDSSLHCVLNKCNRNNLILSTISAFEFAFHKKVIPFHLYFDKLIAVSKFGMEIHSRKSELKEKLVHLYNFYPKLEMTVPNHKKGDYFLFYGRLSYEKGILTLLKAWKNINSDNILKIVGVGYTMKSILTYISQNNIKNIEILGFKSGNELEEIIRKASFIIVPSEWYENNPLTIIEAYSNGRPVIASRVGGILEIVNDNSTGFLFEMGNIDQLSQKINTALQLTDYEYLTMSRNARQFADKNFSEEEHYIKLINIYRDLLK